MKRAIISWDVTAKIVLDCRQHNLNFDKFSLLTDISVLDEHRKNFRVPL